MIGFITTSFKQFTVHKAQLLGWNSGVKDSLFCSDDILCHPEMDRISIINEGSKTP